MGFQPMSTGRMPVPRLGEGRVLKAKRKRLPVEALKARRGAAAMAAATRGRSRVFKDKRKAVLQAKKQIEEQLRERGK